ncbi:MAG: hypothetical protein ACOC5F_01185 [Candidatus Aminicenantaceae bacterium]
MKIKANKAIEYLLARGNLPILYWLKKDILEVPVEREYKNLQKFAKRIRILKTQKSNGGWCKKKYEAHPKWEKAYYIVDTLWNLFRLYNYGCVCENDGMKKALDFLFSTQTECGDFRGAYLNEYAPTYHALTLEIMCLLGLHKDKRVQRGFRWMMKTRQDDGGWAIPYRTVDRKKFKSLNKNESHLKSTPIEPNKTKPFSHLVTGMMFRALSASQIMRKNKETFKVGELLMKRFFKPDKYNDRRDATYWEEINYPFWATNIISVLDSLSKAGFSPERKEITNALEWLMSKQTDKGYWNASGKNTAKEDHLWVTFAILRIMKRFDLLEL